MKTIILAGGRGTRLGKLGDSVPKPMVTIGGKPLLWHIMKLFSHQGFNEFIVCGGYKFKTLKDRFLDLASSQDTIQVKIDKENFEDSSANLNVSIINTGLDRTKTSRIHQVQPYLKEDVNFLTYGDVIADVNVNELLEFHKKHEFHLTVTGVHPPERFGRINHEQGKVTSFSEKERSSDRWINGGFMVISDEVFDRLTSPGEIDFEGSLLPELAEEGKLGMYSHEEHWQCMDYPYEVKKVRELWQSGNPFWKVWN